MNINKNLHAINGLVIVTVFFIFETFQCQVEGSHWFLTRRKDAYARPRDKRPSQLTLVNSLIEVSTHVDDFNCTDEGSLTNLNVSLGTYDARTASRNFYEPYNIMGLAIPARPLDACKKVQSPLHEEASCALIAVLSNGNCSFDTKIQHAKDAGFDAVIIITGLEIAKPYSGALGSFPLFYVNYSTAPALIGYYQSTSKAPIVSILTEVPFGPKTGSPNTLGQGAGLSHLDQFGDYYFHICIYIWISVVLVSIIALSVKWGCCSRTLTRWEVRRLPMKKFQRAEGENSQDKCPICHEDFHEGRFIRQLPCKHCYHNYCVDRWLLKMSNRCPLCKQPVSITLMCPWHKRRRRKDRSQVAMEASDVELDQSPPLPAPLATLTPTSWFGEDIMSAPSRLVIMRPGRPTRVVDLSEKNNKNNSEEGSGDTACAEEGADASVVVSQLQQSGGDGWHRVCDTADIPHTATSEDLADGLAMLQSTDSLVGSCLTASSSQMSSVCSDHPLIHADECLTKHQCSPSRQFVVNETLIQEAKDLTVQISHPSSNVVTCSVVSTARLNESLV